MGYSTDFEGEISIEPPLNEHEIAYLQRFSTTRRMRRTKGPFYANPGSDGFGQDNEPDIIDRDRSGFGQPGLWCQFEPSAGGTSLGWDGGEKTYDAVEWVQYLIDHFLRPGSDQQDPERVGWVIPDEFSHFTRDHVLNGVLYAEGEDQGDVWWLVVRDNVVSKENVNPGPVLRKATAERLDDQRAIQA